MYFELPALPATTNILVWYTQFISTKLKSHASVVNYLAGVKKLHELLGCETSAFKGILLKMTLQGLRRENRHIPCRARPMTPAILRDMYKHLDMNIIVDAVFWCASLFAFFLLFRKSNLMPTTVEKFDPEKQLRHGDCVIVDDSKVVVGIRWAKNAQFGRELLTFPLPKLHNSALCPVAALKNVRRLVKHSQSDHIFKINQCNTLTYRMFQEKLKETVNKTGRDGQAFSSHSYRRRISIEFFTVCCTNSKCFDAQLSE